MALDGEVNASLHPQQTYLTKFQKLEFNAYYRERK